MEPRVAGTDDGFTLIELMVVVAVLSILTLTATLGINRPRAAGSADWARFEAVHARQREQAVMGGEVLGLRLSSDGYVRTRRTPEGWRDVGQGAIWTDPVSISQPFDPAEIVTFLPSGESTPVRLTFGVGPAAKVCTGDRWSGVTCGGQ